MIEHEIREIIKKKGISLYRIAKDLGIPWQSLYRSLQDGANPKLNRIEKLLDYLDYDVLFKPKRKEVNSEKSKPSRSRRRKDDDV